VTGVGSGFTAGSRDLSLETGLRQYGPGVLDRLAALAAQALGAERTAILAPADARSNAVMVAAVSGDDPDLVGRRFSVDAGLSERVLTFGRPMAVHGRAELGQALRRAAPAGAQATAAAPIPFAGRPAGLLSVSTTSPREPFREPQLRILAEFAELCGRALGRHEQRKELAAATEIQVRALETALAVWDGFTAEHSDAVVRLAGGIGRRLGMDSMDLFELNLVARLHDAGKLRVPGEILRKPGPLSAEEREVIELHPAWGAELVGRIPGLEAVAALIHFHHERPDGAGYPHALGGDRIPLAARVVSACDSFGAMTQHRPYRPALPEAWALNELQSAAGRQFDRPVLDALADEIADRPLAADADEDEPVGRPAGGSPPRRHSEASPLSRRELQVLTLLARGASGDGAASALGLTPATIRTHLRTASSKLGAHTRAHAVALALDSGQISLRTDPPPEASAKPDPVKRLLS
jgi:HD-GYP domain-containing protein (c-di-GMP phosphodiesterase class II)/DNA-binding CsgD family transcriptional regulator